MVSFGSNADKHTEENIENFPYKRKLSLSHFIKNQSGRISFAYKGLACMDEFMKVR